MDIENAIESMKGNGVGALEAEKLRLAASVLPDRNISLKMRGLDHDASLTLMSRLLRKVAERLNIKYSHPDVIEIAGLPVEEAPSSLRYASSEEEEAIKREYAENDF